MSLPRLYVSSAEASIASPSSSVSAATRVACQLFPSFFTTNVNATIESVFSTDERSRRNPSLYAKYRMC